MKFTQPDLFAQDDAARAAPSPAQRTAIRARLEATLARLEAAETYPWRDPLDAAHEENRFERDCQALGDEGAALWARFDTEMDRLHATWVAAGSAEDADGTAP